MRTAQDIINVARFDLATTIITLMRKMDAYLITGKKSLMTAPEEDVVIDFADLGVTPAIRVESVNVNETRPLDFIATRDDHNFYVGMDGMDIDADDIPTDDLLIIARVLEDAYANAD